MVEKIGRSLKERVRMRIALQGQLDALVKAKNLSVAPPVPEDLKHLFPQVGNDAPCTLTS